MAVQFFNLPFPFPTWRYSSGMKVIIVYKHLHYTTRESAKGITSRCNYLYGEQDICYSNLRFNSGTHTNIIFYTKIWNISTSRRNIFTIPNHKMVIVYCICRGASWILWLNNFQLELSIRTETSFLTTFWVLINKKLYIFF